ncbi:PP2C family protein-serine/threonine phosphatase [Thermoleophilum album]|uniref:Serine phosphatase RsbU, regulator of sigma subunit n=1 Tax=Thermoleophilum album TaxID=29539 RepID=A0A1H6FJT7_THEAL|nr:PP2C family protein-serine/threonine phosphatase [Thermoleophilum album]SEH10480.1 Serine phosphatase RsbU, regulator of sigma subunit [Thermoleophilum album]
MPSLVVLRFARSTPPRGGPRLTALVAPWLCAALLLSGAPVSGPFWSAAKAPAVSAKMKPAPAKNGGSPAHEGGSPAPAKARGRAQGKTERPPTAQRPPKAPKRALAAAAAAGGGAAAASGGGAGANGADAPSSGGPGSGAAGTGGSGPGAGSGAASPPRTQPSGAGSNGRERSRSERRGRSPKRAPGRRAAARAGRRLRAQVGSRTFSHRTPRIVAPIGSSAPKGQRPEQRSAGARPETHETSGVERTVLRIVEVVPPELRAGVLALGALAALFAAWSLYSVVHARRLERQRRELLDEVGLLQSALLPSVPERIGSARVSVAYRPADGPAAGGDFYDALELSDGRAAFVLGDVSGHGRQALARTAFMRYTLRAYLEAGLEPRAVLEVAGRVIGESLDGEFATTIVAVYDPRAGTLTYACAGHPPPLVLAPEPFDPIVLGSAPPIGVGVRTGVRQTTVPLPPGSLACLFTDGLTEARVRPGEVLGRARLERIVERLPRPAAAGRLLEQVARSASVSDDMAVCLIEPLASVSAGSFRVEELELAAEELEGPLALRFLGACGVGPERAREVREEARRVARAHGAAVVRAVLGVRTSVSVAPANVVDLEGAARLRGRRIA